MIPIIHIYTSNLVTRLIHIKYILTNKVIFSSRIKKRKHLLQFNSYCRKYWSCKCTKRRFSNNATSFDFCWLTYRRHFNDYCSGLATVSYFLKKYLKKILTFKRTINAQF